MSTLYSVLCSTYTAWIYEEIYAVHTHAWIYEEIHAVHIL